MLELGQVPADAVVGEQAPLLLERLSVLERYLARGGVADVGEERCRLDLLGLGGEAGVLVGRSGAAVEDGSALRRERADARAVRLGAR